ncbi:MAG: mevalonate kinase [Candidatus Thermoplasmatota archaeon]|nr:mevalonate kinase [Candidatus Thermoplasmatota archaeon]
MSKISVSAPGKCILFGEHAVVYGHPAVAVAIDQRISVKLQASLTGLWLLDGKELDKSRNPHISGLIEKLWPSKLGAPALSIHIEGNIPRSSGLGSSSALSVALAGALRLARGRWVTKSGCNEPKYWAEGFGSEITQTNAYDDGLGFYGDKDIANLHHISGEASLDSDENAILAHAVEAAAQNGRASPMDSSTCSHGGVVVLSDKIEESIDYRYQRNLLTPGGKITWHIHGLSIGQQTSDVYLVIGNTGIHAPTAKQVQKVADLIKQKPGKMNEIETIGKIARRGIQALIAGDYEAVGRTMSENQLMLRSIGVSSPELDALIKAATPSSLGVKLTGAGGGGCMVALTRNPKLTSDAIELAGGRTFISKLGSVGLTVESSDGTTIWTKT